MKAIVIGATGATGKHLVENLLNDSDYESVTVFVRKSTQINHHKFTEHIINFSDIKKYENLIVGDVIFSCLGTTLKNAGSKENQWKIDFDIPMDFAKIAKQNNIKSFVLVSSYGANPNSKVFYPKVKGELEIQISELHFEQLVIFRPGALIRSESDRATEKLGVSLLKSFNKIGLFKKFKPLETKLLAQKLAKAPKTLSNGIFIVELDTIFQF